MARLVQVTGRHSLAKCSCLLFESNLFVDFIVAFNEKLGLG
jgi:hypothetical protein